MKSLFSAISAITLAAFLRASEKLEFDVQEESHSKVYNLLYHDGQNANTIWSNAVPITEGEMPFYYCTLFKWGRSHDGILALVETSTISGKLLQFDSNGVLTAEIAVGDLFLHDGGSQVKLMPPDEIEVKERDGSISTFLIRDGRLADENGRFFERPKRIRIGPIPEVAAADSDSGDAAALWNQAEPSATTHEPTASSESRDQSEEQRQANLPDAADKPDDLDTALQSSGVEPSAITEVAEAASEFSDENPQRNSTTTRWLVAAVSVASLGLLWLWLKMRK